MEELDARSVLDVGCGTGTFACMLARRGAHVTAVDPARASLDVARTKPYAGAVDWLLGDATTLPPLSVDAAFMTANVAQVFLVGRTLVSVGVLAPDERRRAGTGRTGSRRRRRRLQTGGA